MNPGTRPRHMLWWFLAAVVLGAVDRLVLLLRFGYRYVGSDDAIFWQAVRDYASGIFHEPYFYGQDYTFMTEALVTVPLYWLGVPLYVGLPTITALLALLPFWSFGAWLLRKDRPLAGVLVALLPVLLPVEYGIITSMPRGFVGGCAMLAAWPWCMQVERPLLRGLLAGLVLGMALFLNPNALLFAAPAALLFAWQHRSEWKVPLFAVLGALPAAMALWSAKHFYAVHPERVQHTIDDWMLAFHPEGITEALGQLDKHFAGLMPVLWSQGWLALLLLIVVAVALFVRRAWMPATTLLLALGIVLWSFGYAKVHDGTTHPFFPLSRMFLALPLVLAWWGGMLQVSKGHPRPHRNILILFFAMGVYCFVAKTNRLQSVIDHTIASQHDIPVQVRSVDELRNDCAKINANAHQNNAKLVAFFKAPDHHASFLRCYTCELFEPTMPATVGLDFDRRAWRRALSDGTAERPVLVVGGNPEQWVDLQGEGPDASHKEETIRLHLLPAGPGTIRERLGLEGR
ncbi:MAG: hypothetical protein JNL52_10790 [Flavobacteriales bacterium]|nr:hypothetical protein [Flavobacteriales bacterium]